MHQKFLDRRQAADFLGVSVSTLARWSMLRMGPAFHKIGSRVRYRPEDLEAFVKTCVVKPTQEPNQ